MRPATQCVRSPVPTMKPVPPCGGRFARLRPKACASRPSLPESYPKPALPLCACSKSIPRRARLGRIEQQALRAIQDGAITPGLAFRHYQQTEPLPFLGDLGFFHRLDNLASGTAPLVRGLPAGGVAKAARTNSTVEYTDTLIDLTEAGYEVLEGRKDFVALNGIDRWIGGVHLTSENVWRYEPETKRLARD